MGNEAFQKTAEALRDYVQTDLLFGQEIELDEDLLLTGLIDSINVMNLVARVEEICGAPITPEDVTLENFVSVNAMVEYIMSRSDQ